MKLGDFKGFGVKGNVANPMDWLSIILAGLVVIVGFATSQNVATKLGQAVPIDTKVDKPYNEKVTKEKKTGKLYV